MAERSFKQEVKQLALGDGQEFKGERSPLFGRRGLFRALP